MKFVIVTGMSGAGKSTALKTLEDMGYFCVDNLPVELIKRFAEIAYESDTTIDNVAIGIDIRSGESLQKMDAVLESLTKDNYPYEILFLDASDEVLVKRYKETRRVHPLARGKRVEEGIMLERKQISFLRKKAGYIIDTTTLLTRELKEELDKIFLQNEYYSNFNMTIISFGFKYGIPTDADLVFDVRFLPNPYYEAELKPLTGNDEAIIDYVMQADESNVFLNKLEDMVTFLIPNYRKEGKNQLVVAIGCTGGRHRSVTIANQLDKWMKESPYRVKCIHRDIEKDG